MKRWLLILLCLPLGAFIFAIIINLLMVQTTKDKIKTVDALEPSNYDCILIFGAGVSSSGVPSPMLRDRLLTGIACYEAGLAPKILVSGDHGEDSYDEVNIMKDFCIQAGIPSEDIFMDHAGFSTYESLYRLKEIFLAERAILVTQTYHLHRALYVASRLGLHAMGALAERQAYAGQSYYNQREYVARLKDFAYTLFFPKPTYLGETISLKQSGNITNDKPR